MEAALYKLKIMIIQPGDFLQKYSKTDYRATRIKLLEKYYYYKIPDNILVKGFNAMFVGESNTTWFDIYRMGKGY